MVRYCECGTRITVYQQGKGWVPPPDKDHDQCRKCWAELLRKYG